VRQDEQVSLVVHGVVLLEHCEQTHDEMRAVYLLALVVFLMQGVQLGRVAQFLVQAMHS